MNSTGNMLRRAVIRFPALSRAGQKRCMGGGQPESQSMQARLWEGHKTGPEGWEVPVYATYAGATVFIALALGFAPDTTITTWANNEAQARLDLQSSGALGKPEFGKHYNVPSELFEWESKNVDNPFNEEEDDDEDDEDDDEEDEEEDEDEDDD
mmetsp:Transcript_7887/g.11258  ORF Transcript_7887/g.11258 Transcript_7887/m.11258 type:complete len:154 (+) Transcript_7887:108-569(+)|eukprot:CAMPEP_0184861962 /NCGR_PEP_ID=MMETSP0580-20130426/6526_1 /TAXON_ID=1118495 /ORGANISM="Dactyliosolen fragilissimus" /LENGTH=153 /DNA_ID=CAMNT_0027359645 /DNA_START=131 /DNA_END=592 /DNA_ORIENTATION=-